MDKKRSVFNKKKWLRNHLEEILRLKKQGSTHQAVIQHLTEQQNMPFDLSESLLSRYLKEFSEDESTYKKVNDNLQNRLEGVVSGNGKYSTLRIFTPTSFNDIQHGIFA